MEKIPNSSRRLKNYLENAFQEDNWRDYFTNVLNQVDKGIIPSLFHQLYNKKQTIKWRAVSAFGLYCLHKKDEDPEKLQNIMRRCTWMLTEESGGIAWGVPEVMGEMMANNQRLAKDHHNILFSYIFDNPTGSDNYLEHEPLRFGVIWAVSRLSEVHPEITKEHLYIIDQRIEEETTARGIAMLCRIIGQLKYDKHKDYLEKHSSNPAEIYLYLEHELQKVKVMDISKRALEEADR